MKRKELAAKLESRKIPHRWYNLDGYAEEAFCIEQLGEQNWGFYYGERGLKEPIEHFETEDDACAEMLATMIKKMNRIKELIAKQKK